ncbi:MAG: hypothetical protein WED05_10265 [Candidatus Atabeyarchaeum deiterrae]
MIGRLEFVLAILGAALPVGIFIAWARRKNAKRLPPGSIVAETHFMKGESRTPGTRWSWYLGVVGGLIYELSIFALLIIYMVSFVEPTIDLWIYMAPLVLDLPVWLNWIGIFGIWFLEGLHSAVQFYNVNFTPCYKAMKSKYVLATGGPYKFIRHPAYLRLSMDTIFGFLATGVWIYVFGVISWFALRSQAKAEEVMLEKRFGKVYTEYEARTGGFFPKFRH